jgi:hypothetical protein
MKQNEIIEMADKADAEADNVLNMKGEYHPNRHQVRDEIFAKLVAAKEREAITDEYWSCVQSDLEHGVKSLNEEASRLFHISMPEVSKFGGWLEARGEA